MGHDAKAAMLITEEFAAKIKQDNRKDKIMRYAPMIVLVFMIVIFTIINGSDFASFGNMIAILNQLAIPLVVAIGLTFVIMIGSIDLSINGTVGMAASFMGMLVLNTRSEMDLGFLGVGLAVLASVTVGLIIGSVHVYLKVPSFMVSFAFLHICRGFGLLSYEGQPPRIQDPFFTEVPLIAFLGIPVLTWVALLVLFVCYFIQERTAFGRYIYAVGTDETILRSIGVSANKVKVMVFTLAGFCFGIAGVLGATRLGMGEVMIGDGLMFPAQAAVVIGGTALSGGKGGVGNTVVGVLIMTVLFNGLIIMGVNPHIRTAIQGAIILVAVALTVARGAKIISK